MGKHRSMGDEILKIDTLKELLSKEKEIVDRISGMPNGGHLFLINPFMLLTDVNVELSDRAKRDHKSGADSLCTFGCSI